MYQTVTKKVTTANQDDKEQRKRSEKHIVCFTILMKKTLDFAVAEQRLT